MPLRSPRSQLPIEWWIGRGRPINPYLKGLLVERLRRELRPKELRLIPDELVFDGEREILERTLIYNWVKQWLKWNTWYFTIACKPDPSFAELFTAPICATTWKRSSYDSQFVKYGLVWKCYDIGAGPWSQGYCLPYVLDDKTVIQIDRWILGGRGGTDFIMSPVVDQTQEEKVTGT